MNGISVRERGEASRLVELSGEFDLHDLENLRVALDWALGGTSTPSSPAVVDLSGVTFLDVVTTRELALSSQLHARYMTLHSPSPAVLASVAACGLGDWFRFGDDAAAVPEVPEPYR
ncbi:MAG: STAS domain-containing protein [Rubrobacter sp.]